MKIACAEFQANRFIIDGEIDKKHALQNNQNECGPEYTHAQPSLSDLVKFSSVQRPAPQQCGTGSDSGR